MTLSLATGADLKTTALAFIRRTGVTADTDAYPVWLQLAEATLNRELGPIETDGVLTGVIGSRSLDISALTVVEPIRLWVTLTSGAAETELIQVPSANFGQYVTNAPPTAWMMHNQSELRVDYPCLDTYSFRFRYRGRFALSDGTTNWLLTQHPDVYLAALLVWSGAFDIDGDALGKWKAILDNTLPRVKHTLAQTQRGTLRVDPAFIARRRSGYNINTDI